MARIGCSTCCNRRSAHTDPGTIFTTCTAWTHSHPFGRRVATCDGAGAKVVNPGQRVLHGVRRVGAVLVEHRSCLNRQVHSRRRAVTSGELRTRQPQPEAGMVIQTGLERSGTGMVIPDNGAHRWWPQRAYGRGADGANVAVSWVGGVPITSAWGGTEAGGARHSVRWRTMQVKRKTWGGIQGLRCRSSRCRFTRDSCRYRE